MPDNQSKNVKSINQPGVTLFLFSKANADKLEARLRDLFNLDLAMQKVGLVPGALRIPGRNDIAVVDIDYCGSEEQTAYQCVARIREAGFTGPIIVNEDNNENSSLLHIAGATHSVRVEHEEKEQVGLRLAKTIVDVIKDLERYKRFVRERLTERQPDLALTE